jgi:hypothetical protein
LVATDDFISPTYFDIMGEIFENWAIWI